jgi:NADPH:quinone reductase-like Zn-dependent oxidoreductase
VVRAVVVRGHGGPEVLELCDWPDPHAAAGEIVIGVRAVTVGRTLDVEARAHGADFHAKLPRIPGSDPAGVVLEVGSGVTQFAPGDRVVCTSTLFCGHCEACLAGMTNACEDHRVVGVHIDGGDAERVAVPAASVQPIPDHVDFEQAAAMAVSYPVAWNLLRYAAGVEPGDTVLVMGAGGALGIAGVLVARALGARVIAAAASDWKLDRVRELLGAEQTVNYARAGWADRLRGVAAVYDNISSPELFDAALGTLRPYGRLVTCGAHGGGVVKLNVRMLYRRHLSIIGDNGASMKATREVFAAVADGTLAPPPVFHRFDLDEVAGAHAAAVGRDLFGRVVLTVGGDR